MPRRKRLSDEAVLEIAHEVVVSCGPERFTLADVSKATSLAPATLLQRFGSKEALLQRTIAWSTRRLQAQLSAQLSVPAAESPQALVSWLVSLAAPLRTRKLMAAHLLVLHQDLLEPRQRRQAQRHQQVVRRRIQQHLARWLPQLSSGELEARSQALEALWHGLVLQWGLSGRGALEHWLREGLVAQLRVWEPDLALV